MTDPAGALTDEEITRLHAALKLVLEAREGESPAEARTLVAAAATAAQVHQWDDVIALTRAAIVTDPRSARAWSLLANALDNKGQLHEARRAYETAISLDDKDLATAVSTAEIQAKTGAVTAARALLNFVLMHESGAPELRARAKALADRLREARP